MTNPHDDSPQPPDTAAADPTSDGLARSPGAAPIDPATGAPAGHSGTAPHDAGSAAQPGDAHFRPPPTGPLGPPAAPGPPSHQPFPAPVSTRTSRANTPQKRRLRIIAIIAAAVLAVTATVGWALRHDGGANGTFATALRYVPADAQVVAYTNWDALGHPGLRYQGVPLAGQWLPYAVVMHSGFGVSPTDANWELDISRHSDGQTTVMSFPKKDQLAKLAKALRGFGWKGSTSGSSFTQTAPALNSLPQTGEANWAALHDFHFDMGTRIVVEYPHGDPTPSLGHTSYAQKQPVRSAVSGVGNPATALIRVSDAVCPPVAGRQPGRSAPAAGGDTLTKPRAVYLGMSDKSLRHGVARVVLTSSGAAKKELNPRATLVSVVPKTTFSQDGGVKVTKRSSNGAVVKLELEAIDDRRIGTNVNHGVLGLDACPPN